MKIPAHQIALLARQVHEADRSAPFVLLRLDPEACMEATVDVNAAAWPVIGCRSPLAVRDAMYRHSGSPTPVILLFDGQDNSLGADVLARCAKRRAFTHDVWQSVVMLFRAAQVDPRLVRHRWLAELLIRYLPPGGFAPVRSLVLDEERAWKELFKGVLGFEAFPPTPADLLRWASDPRRREQYRALDPVARQEILCKLQEQVGEFIRLVFAAIDTGHADELLAVGMLCETLAHPDPSLMATQAQVTARLEALFGGLTPETDTIQALAGAAGLLLEVSSDLERKEQVSRFEALVGQLKAEALAVKARYGEPGFLNRLEGFAAALRERNGARASVCLKALMEHRGPLLSAERAQRFRMAVNLVNWLAGSPVDDAESLTELAMIYRQRLAWVDWARAVLLEGDDFTEVAQVLAALREAAGSRRAAFDRKFAEALVSQQPDGDRLVHIEEAIERYIAPIAAAGRLLLIVIDGMSISVFLELHRSLREHGWLQYRLKDPSQPTLLTMLPSTTEASRTSLLSGRACTGNAASEVAAFRAHPGLLAHSAAGKPPRLFHKASLLDGSGLTISDDLRQALSDTRQRVVGVVINAVDDHLMKSEQIRLRWELRQFRGLDALLAEARAAERTVLITSDHGHILEQGAQRIANSPNARWREPNLEMHDGEITLSGNRIKAASGQDEIVLAWSEKLRYATKRNGYHGGCSPAEALAPIAAYRSGVAEDSTWVTTEESEPEWWNS